ncbi:bactofilin family protein [Halorhodospira halochloris]|uniref:bactofilin family protein n=1 Tax=Halorhodospira halochloris TaxID=1052 RepID=UPI001EE98BE0|nr:polymer-forming cytoskeletal protein [Halorhodospira halochloris]
MGIIGKGDKSKGASPGTTVISNGTRLVGELTLESNLHVDGQIKGTIISDHDVSIGRSGRFEGNLKAERLLVSGFVEGVIDCAVMEIVAEGRVFGELHSDDFVIEPGGHFLGESHPRREVPLAELSYERNHEPQLSSPEQHSDQQDSLQGRDPADHQQASPGFDGAGRASGVGSSGKADAEDGSSTSHDGGEESSADDGQTVHREPRRTTWGRR